MKRYSLFLLLLTFYSANLVAQQPYKIIREDIVSNDTVVWKNLKGLSFISIYVKDNIDLENKSCPQRPKGVDIETYNKQINNYLSNYLASRVDSLNDIFLNFFSKETLDKVYRTSIERPIILFFKMKENGTICSVSFGIKREVSEALSSEEFYRIQSLMKHNVVFNVPDNFGLTGCVRFAFPIKMNQIKRKLSNTKKPR